MMSIAAGMAASRISRGGRLAYNLALAGTLAAAPLAAQLEPADPAMPAGRPDSQVFAGGTIRWYHVAGLVAGTSLLFLADAPVERFAQANRSPGTDRAASVFRRMGQPEVYGTVSLGLVLAGLASGNRKVTAAGARTTASLMVAGASTLALKGLFGRERPDGRDAVVDFDPFGNSQGLPSGHTAAAFALATSLADEIHRPWATVGLYALATGTGLSRINDDRHWLSDVAFGAALGITSAKLVSGRWRIFGIRTPSFLATPSGGAGLGWHASF